MRLKGISCAVPHAIVTPQSSYDNLGQEDVEKIVRNSGVARRTALLFGDAGTVAVIDNDGPDQILAMVCGSEGAGYEHLLVPEGGFRDPWRPEYSEAVALQTENTRIPPLLEV